MTPKEPAKICRNCNYYHQILMTKGTCGIKEEQARSGISISVVVDHGFTCNLWTRKTLEEG